MGSFFWFLQAASTLVVAPPADTVAITNVSVLPMARPGIMRNQTVITAGGQIVAVGDVRTTRIPAGARRIDGTGKYLTPGLSDFHVHLTVSAELPIFLGYGVLTVRDLNGSPETLAWRDSTVRGTLIGPRLYVSGPMLADSTIPWHNKVTPKTAADATAEVRRQHAAGYDQLKIYDGLPREAFDAAIATAKALDMPSSGHIPESVGFAGVLASGMGGLEHLDKTVQATTGHNLDTLLIPRIADSIRKSGMYVTPTLESMVQLAKVAQGKFDSLMNRPEALAAPTDLREFWNSVTVRLKGNRSVTPGLKYNGWTDYQFLLAGALARAGVPLLTGTDLPNAVLVPGASLLREMDDMVEAGVPREQVLRASTSVGAEFFKAKDWGAVAVGQRANLVLVDANPLESFATYANPAGAVVAGRWYSREQLAAFRRGEH